MHSSPRVILVEQYGKLCGLLTIKDIIRFLHELEATSGHSPGGINIDVTSAEIWDEYGGTLRTVLETTWEWAADRLDRFIRWGKRFLPSVRTSL